jgi:hypothetical protein
MIRTQIQLTEEQLRRLKALAAARGLSVAELIRQSVDTVASAGAVDAQTRRQRAIAVAGRFRSGKRDVSAEHDRYLAEAWQR